MWEDSRDRLKTPHRFTRLLQSVNNCVQGCFIRTRVKTTPLYLRLRQQKSDPRETRRSRPFAQLTPASLPLELRLEI